MKVLFVNACIRGEESRTLELCRHYLKKAKEKWNCEIEEVNLDASNIPMLDSALLSKRDCLLAGKAFDDPMFDLANQLVESDHILIGAPYWDLGYPAKLRAYLEQVSVTGITYVYTHHGMPEGQCKANDLTYITTSGGIIGEFNFGYDHIAGLCKLFGIEKCNFISAEGMDFSATNIPETLSKTKAEIDNLIAEL